MGLITSYSGLLAARWFLGVAEVCHTLRRLRLPRDLLTLSQAGFFPAATYLLTIWYKKYEYQRRLAVFYASASMAGAFSGLLAFAIEKMDGIAGRSGWQWYVLIFQSF